MRTMPSASDLVDLETIAAAVGIHPDRVRKDWIKLPAWPRGERAGKGGRLVWRVDALPEHIERRGKQIPVRAAVLLHLVRQQEQSATSNVAVATPNVAPISAPGGESIPATGAGGLTGGGGATSNVAVATQDVAPSADSRALAGGAVSSLPLPSSPAGAMPALPARAVATQPVAGSFSEEVLLTMAERLAKAAPRVREEARRRFDVCATVKRLCDAGQTVTQAIEAAAAAHGVPAGTLARWWWGHGESIGVAGIDPRFWLAVLAPRWGVVQREKPISPGAWHAILRDWLRPERPRLSRVYRRVLAEAEARGWEVPSYAAVYRRVKMLPRDLVVLAREGRQALERLTPALQRSVAHLSALEWVNADGHRFDVFVQLPERFGGGIERPHLIAWQDVFSRKIVAWRLSPTLNAHSVLLAFADLVERYGVPDHALFDNGMEFGAKMITGGAPWRFRFKVQPDEQTGVLPLLGVQVHWATPFHGQAKPIERAFRDLCDEIAKDPRCAGAYVGNRPDAKPENYGSRALEWDAFAQIVAEGIARHNAMSGRRTETAKGRSFDEVFAESFSRRVVRRVAASQRAMLLLAGEPLKVRSSSDFELMGNRYGIDPALGMAGARVVVRFDPDDLTQPALVYTPDGRFVAEAQPMRVRFDDQLAAQSHKRAQAQRRRALAAQIKALEKIELLENARAAAGDVPPPAAVGLVQPPRRGQDGVTDEEVARLRDGADALILEMARRRFAAA